MRSRRLEMSFDLIESQNSHCKCRFQGESGSALYEKAEHVRDYVHKAREGMQSLID